MAISRPRCRSNATFSASSANDAEEGTLANLLRNFLSIFFALLLVAVFFWLWGRFGYSFWTIPLIVLFIAAGFVLARWVRQQKQES
jgi:Flp pilus assembly protein TadB